MNISISVGAAQDTLNVLLEALTKVNLIKMRKKRLPPLYESGVVYRKEPPGSERWIPAPRVYRAGHGDCEDLAAWRAAELRLAGEKRALAIAVRTGPKMWHAVVWRANGVIEDPSRALGMKGDS